MPCIRLNVFEDVECTLLTHKTLSLLQTVSALSAKYAAFIASTRTVKMEAPGTYETSVIFRQPARRHIQEDRYRREFPFAPDRKQSTVTTAPLDQ